MTSNTYFNMEAIKKALKRGTLVLTTGAMICFMSSCEINTKKEVSTAIREIKQALKVI